MTKTVDQWAAEACGVEEGESFAANVWWVGKRDKQTALHRGFFRIRKADCREIVREHFRIYTYPTKYSKDIGNDGIWSAYQDGGGHIARERTISKAEIGCITAIYEASQ